MSNHFINSAIFSKLRGLQPKTEKIIFDTCSKYDIIINDFPAFPCSTVVFHNCSGSFLDWWLYPAVFPEVKNVVINSFSPFNIHMRFATPETITAPRFFISEPYKHRFDTFRSNTRNIPKLSFLKVEEIEEGFLKSE